MKWWRVYWEKLLKPFSREFLKWKKKDQPGKKDSGQLFGHFEESGLWCVCAYVTLSTQWGCVQVRRDVLNHSDEPVYEHRSVNRAGLHGRDDDDDDVTTSSYTIKEAEYGTE